MNKVSGPSKGAGPGKGSSPKKASGPGKRSGPKKGLVYELPEVETVRHHLVPTRRRHVYHTPLAAAGRRDALRPPMGKHIGRQDGGGRRSDRGRSGPSAQDGP